MDEIHDQLNFINFTALTTRITELEDTRRVAQLTQTDEWEEEGELERLIDIRDQVIRSFRAKAAETNDPVLVNEGHFEDCVTKESRDLGQIDLDASVSDSVDWPVRPGSRPAGRKNSARPGRSWDQTGRGRPGNAVRR